MCDLAAGDIIMIVATDIDANKDNHIQAIFRDKIGWLYPTSYGLSLIKPFTADS